MSLILWKTEYTVGDETLDADHIIIISLINQLDEAKLSGHDEAAIGPILRTLINYAVGHFRREEELMRRSHYRAIDAHLSEHRLLEQQLEELHDAYQATADPAVSAEIMELLNFWILDHILKCDMGYKGRLAVA
ncbi:MAG: bacteriohemerythrin [Rhodospirillales bacterium]|nr:bacteriohemerythrin [Rhodospirillales bacterium]